MSATEQSGRTPLDVNMMFRGGEWPPVTPQHHEVVVDSVISETPLVQEFIGEVLPVAVEKAAEDSTQRLPRVRAVGAAVIEDVSQSEHKVKTASLLAATIISQAADRARLSVILVPHLATKVLTETQSPTQAAIVGAATYFAWSGATGEILNRGLNQLPGATKQFKEEFPVVVDLFRDSLPGMNDDAKNIPNKTAEEEIMTEAIESEEIQKRASRIGAFISKHGKRGVTGAAIGSTAFVATASVDGFTSRQKTKLNLSVATDASAVVAGVVAGVGQALMELPKHGYYWQAKYASDVVTDLRFWYALAGASVVSEYVDNRKKMKELAEKHHDTLAVPEEQ
ncbi:MAG: hypothetical protein QG553_404 [Patescibacteria group bacterium]|nr:hypothetical protein [Patescibacteria group bacterium]